MSNRISQAREFLVFLTRTARLVKPYWLSGEKRTAWSLLLSVLAVQGVLLYLMTKLSFATAAMFNAIDGRAADVIWGAVASWFGLLIGLLIIYTLQVHVQNKLIIHWRRFLTGKYLTGYLDNQLYNQLELGDYQLDNPDQRISMDMLNIAQETLELGLEFVSAVGKVVVFSVILWSVSGALEFSVLGVAVVIPGYMFWVALVFCAFGTWFAHYLAHPLSQLNFKKQAVEADFRFHLARLREHAESIALLEGEKKEHASLDTKFSSIWDNWMVILKYKRRLMAFSFGLVQGGNVVPFLAAMPGLLAGTIAFGGFMQLSSAFMTVQTSLAWFATAYEKLAVWKSSVDRVLTFEEALAAASAEQSSSGIATQTLNEDSFEVDGLTLTLPTGESLLENSSFSLEVGKNVLILGPSGSGKSTLFRLLSGLWIWGQGDIRLPRGRSLFLPQKPYLPNASLREVLSYSSNEDTVATEERMRKVLRICRLEKLQNSLDETCDWARVLSGGEQQRVSLARAFLSKPDWLFLDEATAALDADTESAIYRALEVELPNTTIVSIAHRESLRQHHDVELRLSPDTRSLHRTSIAA